MELQGGVFKSCTVLTPSLLTLHKPLAVRKVCSNVLIACKQTCRAMWQEGQASSMLFLVERC